jgi:hypothetical protein
MTYIHGELLNLSGLVLKVEYTDDTEEDIPFAQFALNGITTTPANGITLSRTTHNNTSIKISFAGYEVNTGTLTINRAPGAAVSIPTFDKHTSYPITFNVNAITANNGQSIEYNISTFNNGTGLEAWQNHTEFSGRTTSTSYYVYARSVENNNFETGAWSISAQIIFYPVSFHANGGTPEPGNQIINRNGRITMPASPTKPPLDGFAGWYNNPGFSGSAWNFANNPVTGPMTLYARWVPNTAGITLTVANIVNGAPSPADNITLSRTNTGYPQTRLISIVNPAQYNSISWEISGVGAYSSEVVSGTGPTFIIDAGNNHYNSLGGHTLRLRVTINGVLFMRNINFTIVP